MNNDKNGSSSPETDNKELSASLMARDETIDTLYVRGTLVNGKWTVLFSNKQVEGFAPLETVLPSKYAARHTQKESRSIPWLCGELVLAIKDAIRDADAEGRNFFTGDFVTMAAKRHTDRVRAAFSNMRSAGMDRDKVMMRLPSYTVGGFFDFLCDGDNQPQTEVIAAC